MRYINPNIKIPKNLKNIYIFNYFLIINKMKKIIIVLTLIYSIYCNLSSCMEETDMSECQNHDVGITDYSCFKIKNQVEKDEDDKDNEVCTPFPEKEDDQKIFWKLTRGITKELQSSGMVGTQINVLTGEKDFYKKGEEITLKTASLSKDDEKIIKNKNSCSYQLFGRYSNNIKKYPSGYPNVNDPNLCYNAGKFSDLNGLTNCGYGNFTYTIDNKEFTINSCFLTMDNNMPENMQKYYKALYYDTLVGEDGILEAIVEFGNAYSEFSDLTIPNLSDLNIDLDFKQKKSKKRKLTDGIIENYKLTVKDKYGKIMSISSDSEDIQVVEKGSETEVIDLLDNSNNIKLNIILSLFITLLIL